MIAARRDQHAHPPDRPLINVSIFFQRQLMQGMMGGAMEGQPAVSDAPKG